MLNIRPGIMQLCNTAEFQISLSPQQNLLFGFATYASIRLFVIVYSGFSNATLLVGLIICLRQPQQFLQRV
jgi:hypothetical protein